MYANASSNVYMFLTVSGIIRRICAHECCLWVYLSFVLSGLHRILAWFALQVVQFFLLSLMTCILNFSSVRLQISVALSICHTHYYHSETFQCCFFSTYPGVVLWTILCLWLQIFKGYLLQRIYIHIYKNTYTYTDLGVPHWWFRIVGGDWKLESNPRDSFSWKIHW